MTKDISITTIKLEKSTKERLDKLKIYKRETYDEVLNNLLNILNVCKLNPEQARSKLRKIDLARKDRYFLGSQRSKSSEQS